MRINFKIVLVTLLAILFLPVIAMAMSVPVDPDNPLKLAELLAAAIKNSEYVVAALLGSIVVIWILRRSSKWLSAKVKALSFLLWFTGDRGGALLAFLTGALVTLVTALSAGASVTLSLVLAAILGALPAGWFSIGKNAVMPGDKVTVKSANAVVYKGRIYTAKK